MLYGSIICGAAPTTPSVTRTPVTNPSSPKAPGTNPNTGENPIYLFRSVHQNFSALPHAGTLIHAVHTYLSRKRAEQPDLPACWSMHADNLTTSKACVALHLMKTHHCFAAQSPAEGPAASKVSQEQQFLFQAGNTVDAQAENTAMGQAMLIVLALGEAAGPALQHIRARDDMASILSTIWGLPGRQGSPGSLGSIMG